MRVELEKRLFIGIPAGRKIQAILFDIQSSIGHNSRQIRWIPSENIHITLSFLGNVHLDNIPKLTKALEDALDLDHLRISIEKTGIFPSPNFPKILWLGVGRGKQKMMALHEQIDEEVAPFKAGRKKYGFIPHITIGRVARSYGKINVLPFLDHVYSPRELDVNSVALYESQLLAEGGEYKVLTRFPLN